MASSKSSSQIMPSHNEKQAIVNLFLPLVETFKKEFILENPNKAYNYLTDIYPKWHQNYFYLCEKFKSELPDRIADEFEVKFVRLKYLGKDRFIFSYFRHNDKWNLVARGLSADECLEMISSNPVFQPIA